MNIQPPEKQLPDQLGQYGILDVFKVFPTIQGEGPFAGQRAIFVRLAGCNLQCPMCDTDYTSQRTKMYALDLLQVVLAHSTGPGHLVVITGGEPFRQNLKPFINELLQCGFKVQIETNGTLYQDLPYHLITIVCSPKTGSIHQKLAPHVAAYKYVLDGEPASDGLPLQALGHSAAPRLARPHEGFFGTTYLQPADEENAEKNSVNLKNAMQSVQKHGYTLGLQIHKIIHVE